MNKFFLWIAMLPSGLWRSMGADIDQLRAILTAKLKMDDRRPMGFTRQKQRKNLKFASALSMFISAIMGLLYFMILTAFNDVFVGLTAYFTFFLFTLSLTLITDFSSVLVDTRDKFILLPRPVNDKTLVMARLLHVFIYLLRVVLPMSLAGWIFLGIEHGWLFAVWFPVPLLLLVFITLFIVNACYLLLLRVAKPEKFKDIISYFQVALSIVFFALAYLMPRVLESSAVQQFRIEEHTWIRLLPTYWLAATYTWIGAHAVLAYTAVLGILAVILPLICLWVTTRYLSPQFARNMGAMDASDAAPAAGAKAVKKGGSSFYRTCSNLLNKTDAAKAGFMIVWLQTARSRAFRMKIYPGFAFVPIYFVFLLFNNKHQATGDIWAALPAQHGKMLLLLYMCSSIILQAISYVCVSDQYKAAWVYYAAPLETPGHVMAGAFKAVWVKYFLPFFGCIAIFVVFVWGVKALPDVALALTNITLFAACMLRLAYRYFPFSQLEQMKNAGLKTTIRLFMTFFLVAFFGFSHFATIYFEWLYWLKYVMMGFSLLMLWLVWTSYRNTSWTAVKMAEE